MMKAIKMAIKTETDAIAFYKEAAEKTRHPFVVAPDPLEHPFRNHSNT